MAGITTSEFFEAPSEQSQVKAQIVAEYFCTWARIILAATRREGPSRRVLYLDFFAGPGRYEDGTNSTPLLVLQRAIENQEISQSLLTVFNDADEKNVKSLLRSLDDVPGIEQLRHKPEIYHSSVDDTVAEWLESKPLIPTFCFIDPWGYKGVSARLIDAAIKDWGSDCVLFFNYNRINMGITNPAVQTHLESLFGEDLLAEMRTQVASIDPAEREKLVISCLTSALKNKGNTKFVCPFRFKNDGRTSHFLIGISKSFKGYEVVRDIMARHSTSNVQGVPSFEFDPLPTAPEQLSFFQLGPLGDLKRRLLSDCAGRTIAFRNLFESHSAGEQYIERNYKEAVRQLELEGKIQCEPSERRTANGVKSVGPKVLVKFP